MLRTKKKNLIRSTIKKVSGLVLRFFLNGEILKFCFPRFFTFCVFIFIVIIYFCTLSDKIYKPTSVYFFTYAEKILHAPIFCTSGGKHSLDPPYALDPPPVW